MLTDESIGRSFERNRRALELRPSIGQGTAVTRVRLEPGLACAVEEGDWSFTVGMGGKSGGTDAGPNPGIFGRGTLGACLAVGYALWASHRGVPIESLEVTVEADYDARAMYGFDEVPPGYRQIRCVVEVDSPAPREEVLSVLDEADAHSDYLAVFREPQDVRREVRFVASAAASPPGGGEERETSAATGEV